MLTIWQCLLLRKVWDIKGEEIHIIKKNIFKQCFIENIKNYMELVSFKNIIKKLFWLNFKKLKLN